MFYTANPISIAQVREICAAIAGRTIDKGTFSGWCSRFAISGRSDVIVPLDIASSLVTFAMLHAVDARKLDGDGYKKLYPLTHRRMVELYGPRDNCSDWRSADPDAKEAI